MRRGVSLTEANPMCPLFCAVYQVHSVDKGRPQGRGTKQKGCAASTTGGQGA